MYIRKNVDSSRNFKKKKRNKKKICGEIFLNKNKIYISENYGLKNKLCHPRWITF